MLKLFPKCPQNLKGVVFLTNFFNSVLYRLRLPMRVIHGKWQKRLHRIYSTNDVYANYFT